MKITNISSNEIVNQRGNASNMAEKSVKVEEIKKEAAAEKKETRVDMKELITSVDKANKVLFKNNTHLQFRIHEKTNEVMVKVIEDETGEVLREIPPEKMLDMVARLWEIAGVFVDEKR